MYFGGKDILWAEIENISHVSEAYFKLFLYKGLYGCGGGELGEPPSLSPSGQSKFTSSRWERNGTFLGQNDTCFARYHFRAQKSLDFQGPALPMALEMDLPASKSLCPVPYKQKSINSYNLLRLSIEL